MQRLHVNTKAIMEMLLQSQPCAEFALIWTLKFLGVALLWQATYAAFAGHTSSRAFGSTVATVMLEPCLLYGFQLLQLHRQHCGVPSFLPHVA